MLHLTAERLAALADEEPTLVEAAHLAACPECCRERSAYQRVVALAAEERTRIAPPLTSWESLGPAVTRMRSEQAAERSADQAAESGSTVLPFEAPARRGGGMAAARRWGLRAASVIALLGAGAVAGRMTAPAAPGDFPLLPGTPAPGDVRPIADRAPLSFPSSDEATRTLEYAEYLYQQATAYLVKHDTSTAPIDAAELYRARLAALDRVMAATQEAMESTPLSAEDPVLTHTLLTARGAREATLQELRRQLPSGYDIRRF
jgi:hypothetical protein